MKRKIMDDVETQGISLDEMRELPKEPEVPPVIVSTTRHPETGKLQEIGGEK